MRKLLPCLFLVFTWGILSAQFSTHTYRFDNKNRKYIAYVPTVYHERNEPVPLLFVLHGFGDNIDNFSNIGFHRIADTANFIVVYPEALPDPLLFSNAWHSGAALLGSIAFNNTVNDVGFLRSLMDTMETKYQIDASRIYFTGFSFGAFMSNRMGCEASDRVAAIATVSGTIGSALNCQPGVDLPVLHFHGTQDPTISYHNNPYGKSAVPNVAYWAANAGCDPVPEMFPVPDVRDDGRTIEHYVYNDCERGDEVHFYKIIGGTHQWMNATNNDISFNHTIWDFLSRWRLGGVSTGLSPQLSLAGDLSIFPNPGSGKEVYLDFSKLESTVLSKVEWVDALGRVVLVNKMAPASSGSVSIPTPDLPGWYVVRLIASDGRSKAVRWMKQ